MATRVSELRNGAAKAGAQTYADLDDRMLVLDFQAGNVEVFGEVHRRYAGLARHICQRILGNADDADEATQEAMLRVYQGLSRFNGRYALQPWVARIATNVALDVTRARTRRPLMAERTVYDLREELREHRDDPVEALERGLEREEVNEILESLPEHHREALVLREFEGRSHREIGEKLGVTPSQAKALIHRAKGSFRRAWKNGTERRGLAVLAPIFLAPLKVPQLFRRLMIPTQELAASAAATPAATTSVVTTGERITAAAVAVLVAGSAAVGAVALKQPEPKPKPSATVPVQVAPPTTKPEPVLAPVERRTQSEKRKAKVIAPVEVSPTADPVPSETPSPSPSESPSPTSTPPPPPPWDMAFQVSAPGYACGCGPMKLVSEKVYGEAGKSVTFQQTAEGTAPDASGAEAAWSVKVGLFGSAQGTAGTGGFFLYLYTDDRYYEYEAAGQLVSVGVFDGGGYRFEYTGTYHLITTPDPDDDPALHEGTFAFIVDFWGDGTSLYQAQVSLQESAAA